MRPESCPALLRQRPDLFVCLTRLGQTREPFRWRSPSCELSSCGRASGRRSGDTKRGLGARASERALSTATTTIVARIDDKFNSPATSGQPVDRAVACSSAGRPTADKQTFRDAQSGRPARQDRSLIILSGRAWRATSPVGGSAVAPPVGRPASQPVSQSVSQSAGSRSDVGEPLSLAFRDRNSSGQPGRRRGEKRLVSSRPNDATATPGVKRRPLVVLAAPAKPPRRRLSNKRLGERWRAARWPEIE